MKEKVCRAGSLLLSLLLLCALAVALPVPVQARAEAANAPQAGLDYVQGYDQLDKNGKVLKKNITTYDPALGKLRIRLNISTSRLVHVEGSKSKFELARFRTEAGVDNVCDIAVPANAPDDTYVAFYYIKVLVGQTNQYFRMNGKLTIDLKRGSGEKPKPSKVSSIKLTQTKAQLAVGKSVRVKVDSVKPAGASKAVTWKSSNTKVAKVSSSGKITAMKKGSATITATAKDGSKKTARVKVTVYPKSKSVKYTKSKTLKVGKSASIKAKVLPKNACQTVTYTSSNPGVATVSAKGRITAVGPGKATITATTVDGMKKKATLRLVVKK